MTYSSPRPTRYIWVPASAMEALKDLQHRILSYDIEPEAARVEMEHLLSPYLDRPISPWERVEIVLEKKAMSYRKGH